MSLRRSAIRSAVALAAVVLGAAATVPTAARADFNLSSCTAVNSYAPTSEIPSWESYFAAHPDPDAVLPLSAGSSGAGGGAPVNGSGAPNPRGRNLNKVIVEYWDGLVAATASNPDVRVIKKDLGTSVLGRDLAFYVIGTPEHMANLDGPNGDAAFWRGVRSGDISTQDGLDAAGSRPAFAWATATPHGGEAAAGEAITREVYELAARRDCENYKRLNNLDMFLMPVRNPDGHDGITRTTSWGFDPNRDFGTTNQKENALFVPEMNQYPGVFFIDAHQQSNGYFFPPNEDPVNHEISHFSLDFIQNQIGPALQRTFNDQSSQYQNYHSYDLFTPEYGDTVPSLVMGAAGMTYEKGSSEVYAKQVYDHYLAIDTTINLTSNDKIKVLDGWVSQWQEAIHQGQACQLQQNVLVSPLHDTIQQQPDINVCGYFFKPGQHSGDVASLVKQLQSVGVKVYTLDAPAQVNGYHEFGKATVDGQTLPAGTIWIPLTQGTKHWIEAVLEENPYIPYNYYYDVVTWSYPLQRGLAGSGFLTVPMDGAQLTQIATPDFGSAPSDAAPVYAFNTDSMQGLGLAVDLLGKNVNVYRAKQAFDSGGRHYYTGAALVDGPSLAASGVDLNALAKARETEVDGLSGYPVQRYQLTVPKIGLFTGAASIPTDPLYISGSNVAGDSGHCALSGLGSSATSFCEALFTLTQKDKIPSNLIVPVTTTDLTNDVLASQHFTALINPGQSIATMSGNPATITPAGLSLQSFINGGGSYVGWNANGATAPRSVGAGTLTTKSIAQLLTPGSTFDGSYDTTDPVAWGFDLGGWIYRDSSGNAVFDQTTLGSGTSVVTYAPSVASDPGHYGYQTNGAQLAGSPAVVDTPFGAGHAVVLGFNPYFRAWKEQDERLVLNAVLYPTGAALAPSLPQSPDTPAASGLQQQAAQAPVAGQIAPAAQPLPAAKLPTKAPAAAVKAAKKKKAANADRDVRIQVKKADAKKLRAAVKKAHISKSVRRKMRYISRKGSLTLVVKGVRTGDEHTRSTWVSNIKHELDVRHVSPRYALV